MAQGGRWTSDTACAPTRLGRRGFLRAGLAGFGSLGLADLLRTRASAGPAARTSTERTALIVVWLHGGATHLETYDPKPDAPSDFRGPYGAIGSKVPGLNFCELLPRHAALAGKFNIVRSMAHNGFCHQQGQQQMFTGHPVRELKQKPDHPDCLAIAHKLRFDARRELPVYVGVPGMPYIGSAYLGPAFEPFEVGGDPNSPSFSVPNIGLRDRKRLDRMHDRLDLLANFDTVRREIDTLGNMHAIDTFQEQAWNMLSSDAARRAFDINREDPRVRDRYGRHRWGQQCLLARRLVEAGVDLVTTSFFGVENGLIGSWDDHAVNAHCFKAMEQRAPYFDQAVTALVEDIYARGLDRRVMVVVTGEFGRTPRISHVNGVPGRDHWPNACSMLFAGGGMATGQVIGATDRRGEQVVERRVSVGDFLATIYRHLGIQTEGLQFADHFGRPISVLADGQPIPELLPA